MQNCKYTRLSGMSVGFFLKKTLMNFFVWMSEIKGKSFFIVVKTNAYNVQHICFVASILYDKLLKMENQNEHFRNILYIQNQSFCITNFT